MIIYFKILPTNDTKAKLACMFSCEAEDTFSDQRKIQILAKVFDENEEDIVLLTKEEFLEEVNNEEIPS